MYLKTEMYKPMSVGSSGVKMKD